MAESGFQLGRDAPQFYEAHVGLFMAPFVDALVKSSVAVGDTVLDVACGTGFATRAAATMAGPGASVRGTDINPAMITQARSGPETPGADLDWYEASALDLPFGDGEFDAVICQQGLQFFPDPAAGVREMARVTRTGGRVGLTVWSPSEGSPFLHWETSMLANRVGAEQIRFSTTESVLRSWLVEGGIEDAVIELVEAEVDLPPVATYVPEHLKALPGSASFFDLTADHQREALAELDDQLSSYRTSDGMRCPFSSYLATATV